MNCLLVFCGTDKSVPYVCVGFSNVGYAFMRTVNLYKKPKLIILDAGYRCRVCDTIINYLSAVAVTLSPFSKKGGPSLAMVGYSSSQSDNFAFGKIFCKQKCCFATKNLPSQNRRAVLRHLPSKEGTTYINFIHLSLPLAKIYFEFQIPESELENDENQHPKKRNLPP